MSEFKLQRIEGIFKPVDGSPVRTYDIDPASLKITTISEYVDSAGKIVRTDRTEMTIEDGERLTQLRRRYADMGLDEESVEFIVHHCMSRPPEQEPIMAEVRVVNPKGERVGTMIYMEGPGRLGQRLTVGMTPINLREENDRAVEGVGVQGGR